MNKVFLVAGGSGGHLFPALSVLDQLKGYETLILTDHRTEQYLRKLGVKYRKIITAKIQINFFLIFNLIKLFFSILDNIVMILKKKPDIIIGFGGYSSIPTLIAAKILKKKIIIHEQNAVMGKTNRILSKIADIVAITFPKTKFAPNNAIYTGIPLRRKKKIANFKTKKKRIFIVGGSQGAKVFSTIIPESLKKLNKSLLKNLIVIQQARDDDQMEIKKKYQILKVEHKIEKFFYNIYEEYYNSDLIICRCGASTLGEIETFSKPCLLFPLPTSMNNHQYYNAREFEKSNRCFILDENNLSAELLSKKIEKLIFLEKQKKKLYSSQKNIQKFSFTDLMKRVAN
jgi:UDP-N-acetylglucosamine--N-acetylmuramyl-(pentapeptide) pyrophosphoryl-undecaprenol N-acetylglucosamine transferase